MGEFVFGKVIFKVQNPADELQLLAIMIARLGNPPSQVSVEGWEFDNLKKLFSARHFSRPSAPSVMFHVIGCA